MLKKKMKKMISMMLVVAVAVTASLSNSEISNAYDGFEETFDEIQEEADEGYEEVREEAYDVFSAGEAADTNLTDTTDLFSGEADEAEQADDLETEENTDENMTKDGTEPSDETDGDYEMPADFSADESEKDGDETSGADETAEAVPEFCDEAGSELTDAEDELMEFEYKDAHIAVRVEVEKSALESEILETEDTAGADEIEDGTAIQAADSVNLSVAPITEEAAEYSDFISAASGRVAYGQEEAAAETAELKIRLYDISFYTADGRKLRVDNCNARVNIRMNQSGVEEGCEIKVLYFAGKTEEEPAELSMAGSADTADIIETAEGTYLLEEIEDIDYSFCNGELESISFTAAGFSPYAIVTIDAAHAVPGGNEENADDTSAEEGTAGEKVSGSGAEEPADEKVSGSGAEEPADEKTSEPMPEETPNEETTDKETPNKETVNEETPDEENPDEENEDAEIIDTEDIESQEAEDADDDLETVDEDVNFLSVEADAEAADAPGLDHEDTVIEKLEVEFDSGSNKTVTDPDTRKTIEVWTAGSKNPGHRFTFNVNYSTSGTHYSEPKKFQIWIPKSILRNRSGEPADYYEMSVPHEREADEKTEFVYREETKDGVEYIVVYNHLQIPAAQTGYFQVSYLTDEETFEYYDYEHTDVEGHYTSSEPFSAEITVREVKQKSDNLYVGIDTQAKLDYTSKRTPTYYETWNSEWGLEPQAEGGPYFYLSWGIASTINRNTTQKYNFQLTDILPEGQEGELVKYKLQGDPSYMDFDAGSNSTRVLENQTLTGIRYDYVITRHTKAAYDALLESEGMYTITNTAEGVLTSVDDNQTSNAASTAYYSKKKPEPPEFHPESGAGFISKRGDVRKYELSVLKSGFNSVGQKVDEVEGLTYMVNTGGYPYQWTLKEGGAPKKPEDYGFKQVHYELIDNEIYYGDYRLSKDDYEIEELSFSYLIRDASFDEAKQSFVFADTTTYGADEQFRIEVECGEAQWYEIGTFDPNPASNAYGFTKIENAFTAYVDHYDDASRTFYFNPGITGYRITTDNNHYLTQITAKPSVTVKRSKTLTEQIPEDAKEASFKNTAHLTISGMKGEDGNYPEPYVNQTAHGADTLLEENRKSQISKSAVSSANHVKDKNYSITWKIAMWEKIENAQGLSYVNQNSGVFYDLLPEGSALDASSILVQNETGYLDSSAYEAEIHQNYKNSGRTLLVVRIKEPGDYYNLLFDTIHTWESLMDYGVHIMNPAAYETGNSDIKDGYPDNGGEKELISKNTEGKEVDNRALFTDLDPDTDDSRFLYAQTPFKISAITSASTGLDKLVMGTDDTEFSHNTAVKPDGAYTYKLRYANSLSSSSKNNIIYDCMEQFRPNGKPGEWKGKLLSVDVSHLRDKGIDPVVYYSTTVTETDIERITPELMTGADGAIQYPGVLNVDNVDGTANGNWTKVTETDPNNRNLFIMPELPDGKSITAIAVDIRKKDDGSDYTLSEGGSLFVTVHMQAPASEDGPKVNEEESPYVHYPTVYNNVYIATTVISSTNTKKNYFIEQDYTSVKYHVVGDVYLTKVNAEDSEEKIGGITFRLYGTSDYGTPVDLFETTDRYGNLAFKDVERGSYKLIEYSEDPDWLADHHERDVHIDGSGNVTVTYGTADTGTDTQETTADAVNPNLNTESNPYLFGNKERIHTDVAFTKRELGAEGELLKGAKFKLTGISNYGNDITMYAVSDGAGNVVFENLEYGSYVMKEVEAPDRYGKMNASFHVTVDEYGEYQIILDSASAEKYQEYFKEINREYRIYNEKLHEFIIQKQDSWSHETLNGAVFRLYGTSFNGTEVDKTVETSDLNGAGTARFDGLEAGNYILVETAAPTGIDKEGEEKKYILDETKRIVTVGTDGITIDDIPYTEGTPYIIKNAPEKGSLKVVKVWLDEYGDDNTKRSEDSLDIKLSTTKPDYVEQTAKFKKFSGSPSGGENSKLFDIGDFNAKQVISFSRCPYAITEDTLKEMVAAKTAYVISPDVEKTKYNGCTVYGWVDEEGHFYWWSKAAVVQFDPGTERMFQNFKKLEIVDLNGTDTSLITNFLGAFWGCSELTRITGPLYTPAAVNMAGMFNGCEKLTEIESLKYFDTRKVKDFWAGDKIDGMFQNCKAIESLNLSGFDVSSASKLDNMFLGCEKLSSIDFGTHFNAQNVTSMQNMFSGCTSLTSVDTSDFPAKSIVNMSGMFQNCSALRSVDCSGLGTDSSKGCNASGMFRGCIALENLNLSFSATPTFSNMDSMFWNCGVIESLDVAGFNTTAASSMRGMFYGCYMLKELDLSNFNTSSVTTMAQMFEYCKTLRRLDLSNFDTSKVTTMQHMFYDCKNLEYLDISNFNTAKVTNMETMFNNCMMLKELDVSSFNTNSVTSVGGMFNGCNTLKTIWAADREDCFGQIRNKYAITSIFSNCSSLTGGNGTTVKTNGNNVTAAFARIDSANAKGYFTDVAQKTSGSETNTAASMVSYSMDQLSVSAANLGSAGETGVTAQAENDDGESADSGFESGDSDTNESDDGFESGDSGTNESDDEQAGGTTGTKVEVSTRADKDKGLYTLEKNGNVWTYTFEVDDAVWYAWEDVVPVGYEIVEVDGKKVGDKAHPLEVKEGGSVTITNKLKSEEYIPPAYGSLALNKKVFKTTADGAETQITGSGTRYEFTVTLTDENNEPLKGTAIYGDAVFENGTAAVFLTSGSSNAGDTVVFSKIPKGYHFTITEKAAGDVSATCTVTNAQGTINGTVTASGVIPADKTAEVSYRNVIQPKETRDFFLEKKVAGQAGADTEYVMYAALTGLELNTRYYIRKAAAVSDSESGGEAPVQPVYQEYLSFFADETGNADVTITLKQNEKVKFEAVPVGSTYRITEKADPSYRASFEVKDENAENTGNIVTSYYGNANTNTVLTTAKETVDAGETVTVTFTNEIIRTQSLKLTKAVDSPLTDTSSESGEQEKYEFQIKFSGLTEGYQVKSSVGVLTADYKGAAEKTFSMEKDAAVEFTDIPAGASYEITEVSSNKKYIGSWKAVDSRTGQELYSGTGSGEKAGSSGTVSSGEEKKIVVAYTGEQKVAVNEDPVVAFTNTLPTADLSVSKQVTGNFGNKAKEFTFTVRDFCYETKNLTGEYNLEMHYADGTAQNVGNVVFNGDGNAAFKIGDETLQNKFTLGHNEMLTIKGLPVGTSFVIRESRTGIEEYTISNTVTESGGTPVTRADSESGQDGSASSGKVAENGTDVTYTNKNEGVIPTGLPDSRLVLLLLIALGTTVLTLLLLKRRYRYENES
ncbi:MAG: BspA family leucine-rich repeat surface protein [Eubacteriales bacterium]|nr:BspA family leucine-rich repeat surface protein [Eubacteriales bacterium]